MFKNDSLGQYKYTGLGLLNHGGVIRSVFSGDLHAWHGHKNSNRSDSEIIEFNCYYRNLLESEFSSGGDKIISGEDIFHMDSEALRELKKFCDNYFKTIKIVGYVRSPLSFMESAFIQLVKNHNQKNIDFSILWPQYFVKLSRFDSVFGNENVILRHFSPSELYHGDVVKDFFNLLGLQVPTSSKKSNESLSLEALACLYVYRKYGNLVDSNTNSRIFSQALVERLSNFGNTKFGFSKSLIDRVISENRQDIEWINSRLGKDIDDSAAEKEFAISKEQDFVDVALMSLPNLCKFNENNIASDKDNEQILVFFLNQLKSFAYKLVSSSDINEQDDFSFDEHQCAILSASTIGPAVFLREMALSFKKAKNYQDALKCIDAAINIKPSALDLKKIRNDIVVLLI
ncbi:hypothetical protein [Cobetia sp. 5-11-6-3]|uniref:hypothetical protein n=1 Tax=Cobetia sp. 5-11-6-3 TaxID=2737458 RepID=UPI001596555F|nr:hypothetical protein [Cobetia sp. 5-11-6-3]